jgi:hypothetical protein
VNNQSYPGRQQERDVAQQIKIRTKGTERTIIFKQWFRDQETGMPYQDQLLNRCLPGGGAFTFVLLVYNLFNHA